MGQMTQTQAITTILWDVDGTLLDFLYSQRYAITKAFESKGLLITEEIIQRFSEINGDFWKRLELGEITRKELLVGRFIQLFKEYHLENVNVESFRLEYQEALGSVYSYIDDSLTLCTSLKGKYDQYIVTNGVASTQRKKCNMSGLSQVMQKLFISEEVGADKPNKVFFDACLNEIEEKDKSKILIVGDSLSSDIKGGNNAGILTCWYRPDDTHNDTNIKADYEISHLHDIYDILRIFEK